MELHSNLYYKHPDASIMDQLDSLFTQHEGDENLFLQAAAAINVDEGAALAQDLLDQVDSVEFDLGPESVSHLAGYSIAHFVHGSAGDEFIEAILLFLKSLLPEIHAQAWGYGDDDPWEFWFKFEGDELIREDDEPFNDPDEDEDIKASIYGWWHQDMPAEIREGFLNRAQDDDE
ncbi:hypothetical protein [Alkanindiges illinoisensis]|uniref:hypothetical protein n=1 Tax=Alkanindiges illinoisensis TaxID=197183 RepID=UPI00047975B3|nr:hypothetical protein [Alkanindiges illinoisensis]